MMRIHLIGLYVLVVFSGGCAAESRSEPSPEPASQPASDDTGGGEAIGPQSEQPAPNGMGNLVNTVFGFALPIGAKPLPAPQKVYRFQTSLPLPLARRYVEDRVQAQLVTREGTTSELFRSCTVKKPVGRATGEELLAFRVSANDTGGTFIDIWRERDYAAGRLPQRHGTGDVAQSWRPRRTPKHGLDASAKDRRRQDRDEFLRVMEKVQKNEPLTEAELNSSFFD